MVIIKRMSLCGGRLSFARLVFQLSHPPTRSSQGLEIGHHIHKSSALILSWAHSSYSDHQLVNNHHHQVIPKSVTPLKCSTAISRTKPPPDAISIAISTGVQPTWWWGWQWWKRIWWQCCWWGWWGVKHCRWYRVRHCQPQKKLQFGLNYFCEFGLNGEFNLRSQKKKKFYVCKTNSHMFLALANGTCFVVSKMWEKVLKFRCVLNMGGHGKDP